MKKILIVCVLCLFFCGCMETRELKERTIIEAVGIDKKDRQYEMIFQQYQPESAQKAGESSGKTKPVESQGRSISEAIDRVTHYNGNPVFLGNSTYIVLGEDMARQGILQELHYFNGENEISPSTMLVIADGSAKDLLSAQAQSEGSGNSVIRDILKQGQENGVIGECTLLNVMKRLMEEGPSPFLPVISNVGDEKNSNFKITGMAIFDREKMVDIQPIDEAKGILWINDEIDRALLTVESDELGIISAEVQESKTKVKTSLKENIPQFSVEIRCSAQLQEVISEDRSGTLSAGEMNEAERLLKQEVKDLCEKAVDRCFDQDRCDIFRFCGHLKKSYPEYWQQVKSNWQELIPQCTVSVHVDFELTKTGQQAVG